MIKAKPLSTAAFAPYGEVLECSGESITINQGNCQRFHDLAGLDMDGGQVGIACFMRNCAHCHMIWSCWNASRWAVRRLSR